MIAPHTLIRLSGLQDLQVDQELPDWARDSLSEDPFVVVRRGRQDQAIPVGVRGFTKAQRLKGWLSLGRMWPQVTPEQLVQDEAWRQLAHSRQELPVFRALPQIAGLMRDLGWGIGGSVGFELVTGRPAANQNSDLDLLVSARHPWPVEEAATRLAAVNQFGVHADVQIVHGQRGFSLEEYVQQRAAATLVKTADGPVLMTDPWDILQLADGSAEARAADGQGS